MKAVHSQEMVVVTGAARRLGREIALALGRAGTVVGLHYHTSAEAARETAAELRARGAEALLLPADLTQPEEIEALFAAVKARGLPVRALVNSAALFKRANLETLDPAEWDALMNLNLRAPWLCARAAAPLMADGGVMINISDSGAQRAWAGFGAYGVSKAGLEALTRILARTYAPRLRVNAIAPGLILPDAETPPESWARLTARLPLGRATDPCSIAQAVLFLIQATDITGQVLVVDGGYQLV